MLPYVAIEYESPHNELTIAYASALVPGEYLPVWAWYQKMEGQKIAKLPMGKHAPTGLPIKICAQRGIHKPAEGDLAYGWPNGREYAPTIHSAAGGRYSDQVVWRPDGTWTFEYDEQVTEEGREHKWDHNSPLLNCLEDGVPVGVIVGQKVGYEVMGLAYVERYDVSSGTFSLHGPVNQGTELAGKFSAFVSAELSVEDRKRLDDLKSLALDEGDERMRSFVERVRRERQREFSRDVFAAYGGRCAISGVGVGKALQAAHIDDYRSRKSQIVQNGILLRADLHLLYDAHLLGIMPDLHEIVLASSARVAPYASLVEVSPKLRMPQDHHLWPDDELLDLHYQRFKMRNRVA